RCNNNKLEQCCSCHNRKVTTTITTTTTTTTIRTTDDGDAEHQQQRYRCCMAAQDELIGPSTPPHITNIDHAILIPLSTLPAAVHSFPSPMPTLPLMPPAPLTEPSVTVSPSERAEDLVTLLTPPVTPQLVAREEEDASYSAAAEGTRQSNDTPTEVATEQETLVLESHPAEQNKEQDLAYTTPKIDHASTTIVETILEESPPSPTEPCEETAAVRSNGGVLQEYSRSRSLTSLHASSSDSRSSSCSSPTVDANVPPELSKSATVAMLTFQRNRRKGSGRKRKKRRDRHRK
uniref:Uncharacterized protein n=1 Tax=Anopheles maculatus TaxID=74869 RepID=A0A182SSU9_9DIPT